MWLILAIGCRDPALSAFLEDRADAICARHVRCGTLAEAGYADADACVDAVDTSTRALAADGDLACASFDPGQADECLRVYAAADCDTPPELSACDAVCG